MKQETLISILIFIGLLSTLILVVVIVLTQLGNTYSETYEKCCGGQTCSDTIWNGTDCEYTLGKQWRFLPPSWIMIIIVLGVALVLVVRFIVPKEEYYEKQNNR
jgi:H+/Cl- antiporter ClcA